MLAIQRYNAISAIDTAFRVYRQHFRVLFLISFIVNVPVVVMSVGMAFVQQRLEQSVVGVRTGATTDSAIFEELGPLLGVFAAVWFVTMLVSWVANLLGLAASSRVASRAALGSEPTLNDAFNAARKVFWVLLAVSFLTSLAVGLGMFLFLIPGIIISLGFAFSGPVAVIERTGVARTMERSWKLTRGRRWSIFAMVVIVFIVIMFVSGGFSIFMALVGLDKTLIGKIAQTLLVQGISVVGTPIWYVALVLLYYDGRVEQEAFDVEMLASGGDEPTAAPSTFETDVRPIV